MTLELYSEVALTQNIAEHNLKIGDVATLVDFVPHPQDRFYLFNTSGEEP